MINILRQNQRWLMLIIAALTIISFIALYNPIKKGVLPTSGAIGRIYDHDITQTDIDREAKYYRLALTLGQYDLLKDLAGSARSEEEAFSNFVVGLMVLRHQADEMGVSPTKREIAERLQAVPAFQDDKGQYAEARYRMFISEQLGPRGLTEDNVWEAVGDAVRLEKLKQIVGSPVVVTPGDLKETGRIFQKVDIATVKFPLSGVEGAATVSEEELRGQYQRMQNQMIAPEMRKVEYVEFALPADQKTLEGKAKVDAVQKLADTATGFATQAASSDFGKAATAANLTVQTSEEFDRSGSTANKKADETNSPVQGLAPAAFMLTEQKAISDVQQVGDNFYVVKLVKVTPPRALSFDEVRPMLEQGIRAAKARELLNGSANAALAKIRAGLATGQTFEAAAAAVGLKAEVTKDVDFTSEGLKPELQQVARAVVLLDPGQVSNMLPAEDGGEAVFLASRAPLDEAKLTSMKTTIVPQILDGKRDLLFASWLASAREGSGVTFYSREQREQ